MGIGIGIGMGTGETPGRAPADPLPPLLPPLNIASRLAAPPGDAPAGLICPYGVLGAPPTPTPAPVPAPAGIPMPFPGLRSMLRIALPCRLPSSEARRSAGVKEGRALICCAAAACDAMFPDDAIAAYALAAARASCASRSALRCDGVFPHAPPCDAPPAPPLTIPCSCL